MQEGGGGGTSRSKQTKKGGVTVLDKEEVLDRQEEVAKQDQWRVILHNDEVHTFDYVTRSIAKVVKKLTMKKAYEITMETHKAGKATVTNSWKNQAQSYCMGLQQCGLTASIAPDQGFKGDKDGEGDDDGGGDAE